MVLFSSWSKEDKPRDTFYPNQNSVCFLYIVVFVVVYRTRGYLVMMMIATQIQYMDPWLFCQNIVWDVLQSRKLMNHPSASARECCFFCQPLLWSHFPFCNMNHHRQFSLHKEGWTKDKSFAISYWFISKVSFFQYPVRGGWDVKRSRNKNHWQYKKTNTEKV